tara:strand:+ start:294 stop:1352 length:1059 start_codon:yes stop_codon:yes gene_type:complete
MNKYTFKKSGADYKLSNTDKKETLTVGTDHPKHSWLSKNQGRIVTITDTRWSSSNDYQGLYAATMPTKKVKVSLSKLDDLNIDQSLFVPMATGTAFDKFVSQDGGFMPGSNVMAAGAPGIGKTTVLLDLLVNLQRDGKRVLFISAEMSQIDMARYLKRFPAWGQLPILFLADYTDTCPKTVIESVLNEGWDLVLTDSYTEVNDSVKEACGLTRGKTEKWFLDLMIKHNKGGNKDSLYTTFVTILQLSKGGTFVGSNKLKHMTTSMMHLDWDGSENSGRRYMEFSKNRVGGVGKKLYFDLTNGVTFDEARYARDLFNDQIVEEERKQLDGEAQSFDSLFGLGVNNDIEEEVEV